MALKVGKKYYVFIRRDLSAPLYLKKAYEKFKNKPMLIYNSGVFFKIIDKKLKHYECFEGCYFPERFIVEEQLELDFL